MKLTKKEVERLKVKKEKHKVGVYSQLMGLWHDNQWFL